MYRVPEYFPALSLRLAEVLDEIGVNQQMILRRRQSFLRLEVMETAKFSEDKLSCYYFGSQSEGTTTLGLHSDVDSLHSHNYINVIQDSSEWRHGMLNLLMIQDETTAPGYCRLQVFRTHVQLPEDKLVNEEYTFDISGRVVMKNTFLHNKWNSKVPVINGPYVAMQGNNNRHGPAQTEVRDGYTDMDMVLALHCKSRRHIQPQYTRHRQYQMLQRGEENGCFIVPVGHRLSDDECIEWRISPSLQERQLMFSMNITQLRCYILLKMVVKHNINSFVPDCISSFHCKTALFWCKEIKRNDFWRDENLLTCITFCLNKLLHWIKTNYCPQFLIPQENLFAGKVTPYNKHQLIIKVMTILSSNGSFLFGIPFDGIGHRLMFKCTIDPEHVKNVEPSYVVRLKTATVIAMNKCNIFSANLKIILNDITISGDDATTHIHNTITYIYTLTSNLQRQHNLLQEATDKLLQFLYTTLGSLMSSLTIYQGNGVPRQALCWFMSGLDSDVASSRLKLASVLYCSGDLYKAGTVLQDIEERYNTDYVTAVCGCYNHKLSLKHSFGMKVFSDTNDQYTRYTAFCVKFLRSEMFCVPPALQYEMFRSTGDDVQHRDKGDVWNNWAVVDSLPYLYYLQYMTYRQMGRRDDQYRALDNLHWSMNHEVGLGHRETGLNILGKCMELEDRVEEAFICYRQSLGIRPRNNAAKWHITCLTFRLVQNNQRIT